MIVATAHPMPRPMVRIGRELQMPLLTAVAYYIGGEAAFLVGTLSDNIFAPFWPPNVVLFCALMLTPVRRWWLFILAAFPAHVLAEMRVAMPAAQLMLAFATNCLIALMAASALRRLIAGPPWLDGLRKACLYVLITAVASPMVVALGGAFLPVLGGAGLEHYWVYWAQWYLANALGFVTLGPIALIWISEHRKPQPFLIPRRPFEAAILGLGLVGVCFIVFEVRPFALSSSFLPALVYLPLPLVLWAALRFGVKGASSAILIVTIVLIGRTLKGPTLFVTGDAEISVFAIQVFLIGLAVPVLLLGSAIDEMRIGERAVRESEERMALAAASARVCLWHFDFQSARFWLTDHGREMFGFDSDAVVTRDDVMRAIHPEDREAALEAMQAAAKAGRLADCEFRVVRADGGIRWLRCRAGAHGEYRGAPAEVSGTFADITGQKVAEDEVARQRQELAHLGRISMLGELSGGIAHELTQPLSAIMSNAEAARILLNEESPDLKEVAEALDDIIGEDQRAGEVIHRLRGLLKNREPVFETVDVNEVIRSTMQILHNEVITRRIRVTTSLANSLPGVAGDAVQLQQVLLNLVLNAMDAMNELTPGRGRVGIVTSTNHDGGVEVRVTDNGSGLAPAFKDRGFRPFFTTKERGLGLGLSLSSSIIKLHGGTLRLENNPEAGATATFELPCMRMAVAAK